MRGIINIIFSEDVLDKRLVSISWWIVLILTLQFFSYTFITDSTKNVCNQILCCILVFFVFLRYCNSIHERWIGKQNLLIIMGLWIFSVLAGIAQGGTSLFRPYVLFMLFANSYMALIIINKRIAVYPLKIFFYATSCYFLYLCLIKHVDFTEIFPRSSAGFMSIVVLTYSVTIQYIEYRNYGRVNLMTTCITLVICVLSYSRSGLICGIAYFLVVIFYSTRGFGNFMLRNGIWVALTISFSYLVIDNWDLISTWDIYNKFNRKGLDSDSREKIWESYISAMNLQNILLGIPIDKSHSFYGYINPHNSFIQLHSQVGMFAYLGGLYILKGIYLFMRRNSFFAVLLLILLVRGFTDIAFFFNYFDYAIYVLVFERAMKNQNVKKLTVSLL